jgi:hypothetical protein
MENCSRREAEMERKKYFLFLFILLFSTGCANIERNVSDENVFFSTDIPKIKIKIDSSLKYIGKMKKTDSEGLDMADNFFEKHEAFIFGNIGDDNTFKKGVIIQFNSLTTMYVSYSTDYFSGIKYILKPTKSIKINNKNYQQCIFPARFYFQNEIRDIIFDQGYVIPNWFLMRGFSRNVSSKNNVVMLIYYMEEISSFNKENEYSISDWKEINKLREDQQKRLDEFMTECQKNVRFLE